MTQPCPDCGKPDGVFHHCPPQDAAELRQHLAAEKRLSNALYKALVRAQAHLEYCGWGDSWERECAFSSLLPVRTEQALDIFRQARGTRKRP